MSNTTWEELSTEHAVQAGKPVGLAGRFIVPPFSVLDARAQYWQSRKRAWLSLGIESEVGRDDDLLYSAAKRVKAGKTDITSTRIMAAGGGTSIFDPVLCELIYRWFSPVGGDVLDSFAGGSVRGIVAARLGRRYTGIELRGEQVVANRAQSLKVLGLVSPLVMPPKVIQARSTMPVPESATPPPAPLVTQKPAFVPDERPLLTEDFLPELTPIEVRGQYFVKRDDLYTVASVRGGKVRTCWGLARGARGLITAGSRSSPQVNIVAHIAARMGIPCRVHTPSGEPSPEVVAAVAAGAELIQHTPGYNSVIVARAREDALARAADGWVEIPFGMECRAAIERTASQLGNLPVGKFGRLVVPVGSGMSLAGILQGMNDEGVKFPVIGVCVGADPTKRLDRYAPPGWRDMVELVKPDVDYHTPAAQTDLEGLPLDPHYEAKCLPYLLPGDMLWVVGIRQTSETDEYRATTARTVVPARAEPEPEPEQEPEAEGADRSTQLNDLLSGFAKIEPQDLRAIYPHVEAYYRAGRTVRHYHSPLLMVSERLWWGLVRSCLVILKRRWVMGRPVMYLIVPPLHIVGDSATERTVIDAFAACGVYTLLTAEDQQLYAYADHDVTIESGKAEYLYRIEEAVAAEGADWKKMRYYRNAFDEALKDERLALTSEQPRYLGAPDFERMKTVARAHFAAKEASAQAEVRRIDVVREVNLNWPLPLRCQIVTRISDGQPLLYTLNEQVGPGAFIGSTGYHDTEGDDDLGDAARIGHLIDCRQWHQGIFNLGAAAFAGKALTATKEKLQPERTLAIYRRNVERPITIVEWKATNRDAQVDDPTDAPQEAPTAPEVAAVAVATPAPSTDTTESGAPPVDEPQHDEPWARPNTIAPVWVEGDSTNARALAPGQYDLFFSCPPYADLEVYSKDPRDLSNMSYPEFLKAYREIIKVGCELLKNDRFAVFVIGEVRDKKGNYYGFVPDTIAAFIDAGLRLYNEAIIVTPAGSLPLRAGGSFAAGRKLGKSHQNILVFVKGDGMVAARACGLEDEDLTAPLPLLEGMTTKETPKARKRDVKPEPLMTSLFEGE